MSNTEAGASQVGSGFASFTNAPPMHIAQETENMMFHSLASGQETLVKVTIDGNEVEVPASSTVIAAMLGHDKTPGCRCSFVSGEQRGPFCFIGVCHECLVEIDGTPNQQGCLIPVQDGMVINRQQIHEGA